MFLLDEKKIVFLSLFLLKIKELKYEENKIIIKNKCDEYCSLKGGNYNKYGICSCKNEYEYLSMKIKYYYVIIKNIIKQFLLL